MPAVAANLVGLAYVAAGQDRLAGASVALGEAHTIAEAHGAPAVVPRALRPVAGVPGHGIRSSLSHQR